MFRRTTLRVWHFAFEWKRSVGARINRASLSSLEIPELRDARRTVQNLPERIYHVVHVDELCLVFRRTHTVEVIVNWVSHPRRLDTSILHIRFRIRPLCCDSFAGS